jgi:hypothetical protein
MTRIAITNDRADWTSMVSLAHRRTGRVSVGLKAVAFSGKAKLGGIGDPAARSPPLLSSPSLPSLGPARVLGDAVAIGQRGSATTPDGPGESASPAPVLVDSLMRIAAAQRPPGRPVSRPVVRGVGAS